MDGVRFAMEKIGICFTPEEGLCTPINEVGFMFKMFFRVTYKIL